MLTLLLILLLGAFSMIGAAHAQFGSDLGLEIKNVTTHPTVANLTLVGVSYTEMCSSGKCTLNYGPVYVLTPTPDTQYMSYNIDFDLKDNATQNDVGQKKKEFLEKFAVSSYVCHIDDIVEENNEEVYFCHDTSTVSRKFDSKNWDYDSAGIYDAKADTMTFVGNFSRQ